MKTRNRSRSRQRSRSRTRKPNKPNKPRKHRFEFNPAKNLTLREKTQIIREIEGKKSLENMIRNNLTEEWDWYNLSENPNISLEFVEAHLNFPWDANMVYSTKLLPVNFFDKASFVWNWSVLSKNPSLDMGFVSRNRNLWWDWKAMSENPSLTMDLFEQVSNDMGENSPWDSDKISRNPFLTMDFVENHIVENNWDWDGMSINPAITMEFVQNNIDLEWTWWRMSGNPSLTMDFVENHMNLRWHWTYMSINPSLTMEFVQNHPNLNWNWEYMSGNPSLTMEFLEANLNNPNFRWDWDSISKNPNLTEEFIKEHPEYPWDWPSMVFGKAQISLRFVMENRNKIGEENLGHAFLNPWVWYSYVIGDYDELPPIDYSSLNIIKGLYDDNVFNRIYDEYVYRDSQEHLSDLLGEDVTEHILGPYITGRRMYKRKSR